MAFYGWWDVRYVPLLLASAAANYAFGLAIARSVACENDSRAARLLACGVIANLAALGYFKYAGFLVQNLDAITGMNIVARVALPLGISFFTFTQIAFLVDVRRGFASEYSPSLYLLFVTYFPHLIAGPIIHHKEMMPQFARAESERLKSENVALGLAAFAIGLAKKVLIADQVAQFVTPVFAVAAIKPVLCYEAWIGAIGYTLQLYFDFSGYSDMAIGLSLLFGIKLPINFDSPYQARDISDFWRRWHMTLYGWFNEYLFTPSAIALRGWGKLGVCAAILETFTLSGLWHGAAWTFVAWGAIHGGYLVTHYWWRRQGLAARCQQLRAWPVTAWAMTFLAVVLAFVFFRADSFATATRLLGAMLDPRGFLILPEQIHGHLGAFAAVLEHLGFKFEFGSVPTILTAPLWLVPLLLVVWLAPNTQEILGGDRVALLRQPPRRVIQGFGAWRPSPGWALMAGLLLAITLLSLQDPGEFLYYQF